MTQTTRTHAGLRLAIFVLLASAFAAVPLPTATAATTRTLEITDASANPQVPFQDFDGNPPKAYDINGDGRLEIIVQNDNQWVYVFDSSSGAILAELKTNLPPGWSARSFNGPEVTLLEVGGTVRVVIANSAATITMYRFDLSQSGPGNFQFHKEWERRLNDCHPNPAMDSKPVLADLDRDGAMEILANTEERGLYVLKATGSLLWKLCLGGGNAEPGVADLDNDGWPEVIHVSDAGIVTAIHGRWNGTIWSYNARTAWNLHSGSIPVGPGIGQLDGVDGPDIVVGARDSHDAVDWNNSHALLLALNSTGKLLWGRQDANANPLTYTHPIVVDADADGQNEVYWGDWNTIGHKPPDNPADAWKSTGPANFYRYNANGDLVWRTELDTFWSNKDLAVADVDGDGAQEVLANGPAASGHDGIWYLDGQNGSKEAFVDLYPYQAQRGPIVADLAGDGGMDWVIPVSSFTGQGGDAILVYDTGVLYSSKWPHLPYPQPAPGLPPPVGSFDATFTVKSPQVWWQEVRVAPNPSRPVSAVEIRLDEGAWRPMTLRSWGAWATSYQVPANTTVEFRAWDAAHFASVSLPFRWMNDGLSKGSTTPITPSPSATPTPAPFTATFQPSANSNEWWVEVNVTANQPLAGVDAGVNGGEWRPLDKKSWGNWAKSFYVAQGSKVVFRATSTSGDQATSQEYTWLGKPPPQPFTVTFEPRQVGNDWWLEVKISSTRTIVGADVQLNGGDWRPLAATDWGTWAKSYHAPNGTTVKFRATSEADGSRESSTVTWT